MTTDMTVANTILAHLGGNRFRVMTGAKNFVGDAASLSFKVGRNAKGVTHVRVTLDPSDTYSVVFSKVRGTKITTLAEVSDVYVDVLRSVFTNHTGLDTSL